MKDLNDTSEYKNFRILGIGELSDGQIERREDKANETNITTGTVETANIVDDYLIGLQNSSIEKTNYVPYFAIGGALAFLLMGLLLIK